MESDQYLLLLVRAAARAPAGSRQRTSRFRDVAPRRTAAGRLRPRTGLQLWLALLFIPLCTGTAGRAREFLIPTTQSEVDGDALGVAPGDVLAIVAGERPYLRLRNLEGSAAAPIVVCNRGGAVVLRNQSRPYALKLSQARYVRLTGAGVPGCRYGFVLAGTGEGGSALIVTDFSSDCEIDHLHILRPAYAGMLIKTDGAPQASFAHLEIHDNYIHDTPGEGLYIGETKRAPGQTFRGVEIWNNVVARTGYESCQLAHTIERVRVHHNVFYRAGLRGDLWQDNNFQLAANAACEFFQNIVIGANTHLVISMGGLPKVFRDNYFSGCVAGPAFQVGDSDMAFVPDSTVRIEGNYFHDIPAVQSVIVFTGTRSLLHAQGNRWDSGRRFVEAQPLVDLSKVLFVGENPRGAVPPPRFVDEAHDDFRLEAADPYRARGIGLLPEPAGENSAAPRTAAQR